MELRHLRTFVTAAELESFTRAAESLSLTQAAISQHIATLEKELHVSLFERLGRSVKLTDSGALFHDYAQRVLDLIIEAKRSVGSEREKLVQGKIRIAASTVPAETVLPDLLVSFRKEFPQVTEYVEVSDSETATRQVEDGYVEVGLVGELPRSSILCTKSLGTDELIFVTSPQNPLCKKEKVTLKQLQGESFIAREAGSGSRRCVEQALEALGVNPNNLSIVMEMNSNDAIRTAVERELGSAFLSRRIVSRDLEQGRLVTLPVPGLRPHRQLYLVTNPKRIPSLPLREFLDFVEQWSINSQKKNHVA